MRQAIQELQPQGAKPGQAGLLWPVFLSALMTLGGLLGVNQTFGGHTPGLLVPVLAGLVALLCCLLGWAFQEKHAVLAALPVLPWVILFAVAGPAALWRGGKLWPNDLFTRWNLAHDGALSLFQVEGTMGDLLALACLLALLCGCAVWFFVAGRDLFAPGLRVVFGGLSGPLDHAGRGSALSPGRVRLAGGGGAAGSGHPVGRQHDAPLCGPAAGEHDPGRP